MLRRACGVCAAGVLAGQEAASPERLTRAPGGVLGGIDFTQFSFQGAKTQTERFDLESKGEMFILVAPSHPVPELFSIFQLFSGGFHETPIKSLAFSEGSEGSPDIWRF